MAGIVSLDDKPISSDDIRRMEQSLKGRGGDLFRIEKRASFAGFFAGFNHTPEDIYEKQPLVLPDDSIFMFCGRLDNRPDLINELGIHQGPAKNLSDSEIAAKAWLKWSTAGLYRWIGPHATIIWDRRNKKLSMVQGVEGYPSLIFHRANNIIYFSTFLDTLFSVPRIPKEINEHVLADVLLGSPEGKEFLYSGIESVPASHWIEVTCTHRREERFWRLSPGKKLSFKSEAECWEAFECLFREVVAQHLRSTGEVGLRLSGGLDSSLLAAFACKELSKSGKVLHGYTRVPHPESGVPKFYGNKYTDEASKVSELKKLYPNLKTNFIHPRSDSLLNGIEEWFSLKPNPQNISPTYPSGYIPLLENAQKDQIKVLLSAGLGNHTFSYTGFGRLRELFLRGRWFLLRKELNKLKEKGYNSRFLVINEIIKPLMPLWYQNLRVSQRTKARDSWDNFSAIHHAFASKTGADTRMKHQQNLRVYLSYWSNWKERSYWYNSKKQVFAGQSVEQVYGFDERDPSGDRRIAEFCLALPERFYLNDGVNRRLVRMGMRHLLPEAISDEYKSGLQDADWFYRVSQDKKNLKNSLDTLRKDNIVGEIYDFEKLDKLWQEFESTDWTKASRRKAVRMQLALLGPLHAGNYIRWFNGAND